MINPFKKPLIMILSTCSLLVGCTAYNESFDCPAGKGIGCQSVTEVKKKLDQGAIDIPESTMEAYARRGSGSTFLPPVVAQRATGESKDFSIDSASLTDVKSLLIQRTPEKPLRVWIAPYQDQEGNFHEASVVHTVVRPGYWQIQPNASSFVSH